MNKKYFFQYGVTILLAAGATNTGQLTLQADSDFELHCITGHSTADAATDFAPNNFSCQVSNQSSGRNWSNIRVPQREFAGNSFFNSFLQKSQIILTAQSVITFDVLDLKNSGAQTVTIVLTGYSIPKLGV